MEHNIERWPSIEKMLVLEEAARIELGSFLESDNATNDSGSDMYAQELAWVRGMTF